MIMMSLDLQGLSVLSGLITHPKWLIAKYTDNLVKLLSSVKIQYPHQIGLIFICKPYKNIKCFYEKVDNGKVK